MIKCRYIQAFFFFLVVTLAVFLYYDHINEAPFKQKYYYIWDKLKDFLFMVTIAWLIPRCQFKLKILWFILSIFFFIRVVWQVWEMEDYLAANRPYIIDMLFLFLMFITYVSLVLPDRFYTYLKNKMQWRK